MHDLIIKNGTVVDGSGQPAQKADVAIKDGRIAAVGENLGEAKKEIDAEGLLVAPGWVDIHTHYDGQVTWDPYLTPSSWHGATTVVMGNCGVGFAPAAPDRHDWLIGLMEGVEDIPGSALAEGIQWEWETFSEYMDALDRRPLAIDVAAQVPHGAVRAYVMGDRGAKNEKATPEDIEKMADVVRDGMAAGALGFSTSRTVLHRAIDGEVVPGTTADNDEMLGIARVLGEFPHGVFEMASDLNPEEKEFDIMAQMSRESGMPVSFACLQSPLDPDNWRRYLESMDKANANGAQVTAQIAVRGNGLLLSLDGTAHPFISHPSYVAIAHLPFEQRLAEMKKPEFRAKLLSEKPDAETPLAMIVLGGYDRMFPLGKEPNYEPGPEDSLAAIAKEKGVTPEELAYDILLEDEGRGFIYLPLLNYANFNLDHVHEMMDHPYTRLSLSDGGAHCGVICDASYTTFMLTHWARDRKRGPTISIERAVQMQTRETAEAYGLHDRGLIAPGMKADVNVIDFENLKIKRPQMVYDLPANGRRLVQEAEGYVATIVNGEVIFENGKPTGALPGHLIRGAQAAPQALAAE